MVARTDTMQRGHFTSGRFGGVACGSGPTIGLARMRYVAKYSPNTKRRVNDETTGAIYVCETGR